MKSEHRKGWGGTGEGCKLKSLKCASLILTLCTRIHRGPSPHFNWTSFTVFKAYKALSSRNDTLKFILTLNPDLYHSDPFIKRFNSRVEFIRLRQSRKTCPKVEGKRYIQPGFGLNGSILF